jgi:hypothetical protein
MTKFTITGFTFFLGMAWCSGQTYHHVSSWSRLAVQKEFNEHWSIMADIHWRRQNDFTTSTANPFSLRLMEGFRITGIYRINNFAFSFAPFLLRSYPLYGKLDDFNRTGRTELRPALFVEWSKDIAKNWIFRSRIGYEYRFFKRLDDTWGDEQARLRLRLQLRYNWNPNNTIFISEEPLYNLPPNLPANAFSQNQLYLGYNHRFTSHFSTEIGYSWNHRQRAALVEFDEENILQTHFVFRL